MRKSTAGLMILTAAALSGCATPENDRIALGRSVRLETFSELPAAPEPAASAGAAATPAGTVQGSLVGLERGNWDRTLVLVPVDGTAHRPTYTKTALNTDSTARQRMEYPTALSSLELTGGSEGDQQVEAIYNALLPAADVILLIPRMIYQRPRHVRWSPNTAYARVWTEGQALPQQPPEDLAPFEEPAPTPVTP